MPRGSQQHSGGENNIKNEISTAKFLREQIFSQICQLLKNHSHRVFNIFWGSMLQGVNTTFWVKIIKNPIGTFLSLVKR